MQACGTVRRLPHDSTSAFEKRSAIRTESREGKDSNRVETDLHLNLERRERRICLSLLFADALESLHDAVDNVLYADLMVFRDCKAAKTKFEFDDQKAKGRRRSYLTV